MKNSSTLTSTKPGYWAIRRQAARDVGWRLTRANALSFVSAPLFTVFGLLLALAPYNKALDAPLGGAGKLNAVFSAVVWVLCGLLALVLAAALAYGLLRLLAG